MFPRPAGTSEGDQVLDEAVTLYLEATEAGRNPDRQEWLARYPGLAAELAAFFADHDQVERWSAPLRAVARAAPGETPPTAHTPSTNERERVPTEALAGTLPRSLSGYELLEEIGRGGMAVVYKARDQKLGRLVAVKMLRVDALSGEDVPRFRHEAETLAHVDHPHIVPVYDVGECGAGGVGPPVPYFSMKLMEGGSLVEHLDRFRVEPKSAARLLVAVAQAVHHAHQRGILHRDLKPSNILLDAAGRPHVTDFGLAKKVEGDPSWTHAGDLVGTPKYMAPEQASRQKGAVTTATDVYGVGAVLYALVTGRPPFEGETVLDTLQQVRECEPVPPRALNPRVDRDLETVCLKCLEKEPHRRYGSALALAEDLERWLDGEPIQARRARTWERLGKWAKRRPAVAALLVVSGLSALGLFGGSWWYTIQLRTKMLELTAQQEKTREEADRAEANFAKTLEAVDKFLSRVGQQRLANVPGMEQVRREVLEEALVFFQGFLHEKGTEPGVRRQTGHAYYQVGQIAELLGRHDRAEHAMSQALEVRAQLAADFPTQPEYRYDLAACHGSLSLILAKTGQPSKAQEANRQAHDLLAQLAADFPSQPKYRRELAVAHCNLAGILRDAGRLPEAETAYGRACGLLEQLVADLPGVPDYRGTLANVQIHRGDLLSQTGRLPGAETAYSRARDLLERLAADFPAAPEYRSALASCHGNLANLWSDTGRGADAETAYGRALNLLERLAADFPGLPDYRHGLAVFQNNLGIFRVETGQFPEAEEAFRQALKQRQQLVAGFPTVPDYRRELAATHYELGTLLIKTGRLSDAEAACGQARDLRLKLVQDFPGRPIYQRDLADSHNLLGGLLRKTNRLEDAEEAFREALKIRQRLADRFPTVPDYRQDLANICHNLACVLRDQGRLADAERFYRQALPIQKQLTADFPEVSDFQHRRGASLADYAKLLRQQGDLTEARLLLEQAISHQQAAFRANRQHPGYRQFLGDHYCDLAETLLAMGSHAEAAKAAEEAPRLDPSRWQGYEGAVRLLAQCLPLAEKDDRLPEAQRRDLAKQYADRAVALLGEAVNKGYRDAEALRKDAAFEPLRGRADFQELLRTLEEKAKPD